MNTYLEYKEWFENYIKPYIHTENKKLKEAYDIKRKHTYAVVAFTQAISKEEKLNEKQIFLAKIIALFHDIGRFEQQKKHHTFKDHLSEDHAQLSNKILKENNILKELNQQDQTIITTAIYNHNKDANLLPKNIDKETTLQIKVIRDADKLDNFRIKWVHKTKNIEPYSKKILEAIQQEKSSTPKYIKHNTDTILYTISWIYDLNTKYSYRFIKEKNIIDEYLDYIPTTKTIEKIRIQLKKYVEKKLFS